MADLKIDKNRYTVDSLYQWDINQELKIYGLSMLDPEIHFTNEAMGGSIVVDCTVDESGVISVNIPNSLLQYKYSIVVYVAGFEGDTFKTYHKVTIPVKARKRPGDYTLSLSDNEVYSFRSMSDRISNIEDEIKSEGSILYNYTYDADDIKLVEASGKKTIGEYIPLVSNSLKAVKSLSDKFKTMIDANTKLGETALSIAKGINSAKVFDTTADMETWLSDEANKGKCQVGNNLYIVDIDVPDWWIAEVLDTPDSETGFYYKIAQLEVQKVDLTDINNDIDTLQVAMEDITTRVIILENGCTLPPRPVTVNYAIIENGTLEIEWVKPAIYDVQLGAYNVYGYVGDTTPTDFNQFTLITTLANTETSAEISVSEEYDYILIASVSTDGAIQKDLSQREKTLILNDSMVLEDLSWSQINAIATTRQASNYFAVGDTKTYKQNGFTQTAMISGFNHDTKEDGSTAPITFSLVNGIGTLQMEQTAENGNGWSGSYMYSYLHNTHYNNLPSELRSVIKPVKKKTSKGNSNSTIVTSTDKLFLFSEVEVFGSNTYSYSGEGTQYDGFKDANNRIKCDRADTTPTGWWLRSPKKAYTTNYNLVTDSGTISGSGQEANKTWSVVYGFCI